MNASFLGNVVPEGLLTVYCFVIIYLSICIPASFSFGVSGIIVLTYLYIPRMYIMYCLAFLPYFLYTVHLVCQSIFCGFCLCILFVAVTVTFHSISSLATDGKLIVLILDLKLSLTHWISECQDLWNQVKLHIVRSTKQVLLIIDKLIIQ